MFVSASLNSSLLSLGVSSCSVLSVNSCRLSSSGMGLSAFSCLCVFLFFLCYSYLLFLWEMTTFRSAISSSILPFVSEVALSVISSLGVLPLKKMNS